MLPDPGFRFRLTMPGPRSKLVATRPERDLDNSTIIHAARADLNFRVFGAVCHWVCHLRQHDLGDDIGERSDMNQHRLAGTARCAGQLAVVVAVLALAACGSDVVQPGEAETLASISAGGEHTCAVSDDAAGYCWGSNEFGQIGNGARGGSVGPTRVAGPQQWLRISAGRRHSCGLAVDGRIACWGWNRYGQLGVGGPPDMGEPFVVAGDDRYSDVSAGWYHTCAIASDGAAWCWGQNGQGQVGDGTREQQISPARVVGEVQFGSISAGAYHSCGVALNGAAWCWGLNNIGQLGDGTVTSRDDPVPVQTAQRFRKVAAGVSHTCGVTLDSVTYCWGSAQFGEIGAAVREAAGVPGATVPVHIRPPELLMTNVTAGTSYACGVTPALFAYCWGLGTSGQLGVGDRVSHAQPRPVYEQLQLVAVSAGDAHACGLNAAGVAYCWGDGRAGQLGPASRSAGLPVRVERFRRQQ
jgi:alpha-tubulin suppressor-like RCC1 family protein